MLKIRLQRIGKRGQAYFKVVVTEHTTKTKGKYLELLGSYDPHQKELKIDADKVKHWMGQGAQLSPTVNNLLISKKIIEGEKVKAWKPKKKDKEPEAAATPKPLENKAEAKPEEKVEAVAEVPAEATPAA